MSDDGDETEPQREPGGENERGRLPVLGWLRAITGGLQDTWDDMLSAGRKGAQRTHDAKWAKFEAKRKRGR